MKKLIQKMILTSAFVVGLSSASYAMSFTTESVYAPSVVSAGYTSLASIPTTTPGVYTLDSNSTLSLTGSATVNFNASSYTTGTSMGSSTAPWNTLDSKYLAVYKGGVALLNFTTALSSISFDWSTVDDYNSIDVTTTSGTYTLSGSTILAALGVNTSNASTYFTLNDATGIKSIALRTLNDAFEISDIKMTAVPLPGALVLFAPALAGLVLRRKAKVSA